MTKITLTPLVNLQNETTAVSAINANDAVIVTAFDNTLSRDGTIPNTMGAALDMNSNQIINLPAPSTVNSPARLIDVVSNPSIVIPGTGTSGHTVPFLDGNNTWSGSNTYNGTSTFKGPLVGIQNSVKNFGAVGNGITDDTAAFNAAIAYVFSSVGSGGAVYVPEGIYYVSSTLVLQNIKLIGAGRTSTYITCGSNDISVINMSAGQNILDSICFFGKGIWNTATGAYGDPGAFGSVNPTIVQTSSGSTIQNCTIFGGQYAVSTTGVDCLFLNNTISNTYGVALWYAAGSSWYIRNIFDHNPLNAIAATNTYPFPAWQASHAYTAGTVVSTVGYNIQCITSGVSGSFAPTLKNYTVQMTDGTAVWILASPATNFAGIIIDSPAGENRFYMADFTSAYYAFSALCQAAGTTPGNYPYTSFIDSILGSPTQVSGAGNYFQIKDSAISSSITAFGSYTGTLAINDNFLSSTASIVIFPTVSNFAISNNICQPGATITVNAGASDFYNITNNNRVTVTDGGTGINKTVSGNH